VLRVHQLPCARARTYGAKLPQAGVRTLTAVHARRRELVQTRKRQTSTTRKPLRGGWTGGSKDAGKNAAGTGVSVLAVPPPPLLYRSRVAAAAAAVAAAGPRSQGVVVALRSVV